MGYSGNVLDPGSNRILADSVISLQLRPMHPFLAQKYELNGLHDYP
jgi:hypothetical protein